MARERTVYFIDGSAQMHRAYHAIRSLTTSKGLPTNATYGFTTMLRKLVQDEQPQWMAISFDLPGATFRHQQFKEYKANRTRMADELSVQLPYIRRVCGAFHLPILDAPGFEADDVIATLSRQAVEAGYRVVVVTGDKDFLQMVTEDVLVLNPGREGSGVTLYDRKTVEEKFGVPPERVVDVLALMGDASDNVPGVAGIGDKGARDLVREFGALEDVLANADKVKRAAYREGLVRDRDRALLSKDLVTLRTDAPVTLDLEQIRCRPVVKADAYALFTELEFVALAKEYAPEPTATRTAHDLIAKPAALKAAIAEARAAGRFALSIARTAREPMRARIAGIALCSAPGRAAYVPLAPASPDLPVATVLAELRPLLQDPLVAKVSARGKHDRILLLRAGIDPQGLVFDAFIAAYLLDPGRRTVTLEDLAREFLDERPQPLGDVVGAGDQDQAAEVLAPAAAQEADLVLRLSAPMSVRLEKEGLTAIFRDMELPLSDVLAQMEMEGVKVDVAFLNGLNRELEEQLAKLTTAIHAIAGVPFNINSPPQLGEVLFERLGLKSGKKTAKTRKYSTAEEELEELAAQGSEICRLVLQYRSLQKLKGTYVDALPVLVHPETGRIHASLNQTVAATGRISSSDPNLQNIPIRTTEGKRIREAFVAEPGHVLLSADYSQIELRILAHLSQDPTLIDTFRRGEDVHDRTSREIFGELSPVPPHEQRRVSKMVNYALLYGKTAFTLAKDIETSRGEAQAFIDRYFERLPAVRKYIDETIAAARESGSVRTLLGRLRRLPELKAKNPQVRAEAERQAMNTPVQGSAADLIKRAMIDLERELRARRMKSRLILQIHDELLLEVPEAEAEQARDLVKQVMEGALSLDVPLVVDARLGRSWAEVH